MKPPKLESLIKKLKLQFVNSDINSTNFPDDGRLLKDFKVFHFDRLISSDGAIAEMKKENYEPANLRELLSWGVKNWDGKEYVIALGSVWRDPHGYRGVPCLGGWGGGHSLGLLWGGSGWLGGCRFLAVVRGSGHLDEPLVPSTALQCEELPKELTINGVIYKRQ